MSDSTDDIPMRSTEDPEGSTATEFGGVSGLVPPESVHQPTGDEKYLLFRSELRRSRRATQRPYGE